MNTSEVIELSKRDAAAAHRLVARSIGAEGHKPYFEWKGRQACIEKAMSKPLPGSLADTFISGTLKVNGKTIYEVVPTHIKCLQAVNSPLLEMGQKAAEDKEKKADKDFTEEEEWELAYIFTTPPRQLREELKKSGPQGIKVLAKEHWDGKLASEINVTCVAVIAQYVRHIQTTVKFSQEMEASGDVSFFRDTREKSLKQPASAGS